MHIFFLKSLTTDLKIDTRATLDVTRAHGPQLAHLSETTTADMQMACNIFPILSNIETYDKAMA